MGEARALGDQTLWALCLGDNHVRGLILLQGLDWVLAA
jgi:hypothetical protein